MNTPNTLAADAQTLSDVATDDAPAPDPDAKRLPDVDALRGALHKVVADADERALLFLTLAHNRTVGHTGVGKHIYPPIPQSLLVDSEEQLAREINAALDGPSYSREEAYAMLRERFE